MLGKVSEPRELGVELVLHLLCSYSELRVERDGAIAYDLKRVENNCQREWHKPEGRQHADADQTAAQIFRHGLR